MKLLNLLRNILPIFFMLSIVAANNQQGITILGKNNVVLGKADVLKQNQYYLSVNDLGKIIGSGSFVNEKTEKIVIYIDSFKIKLSHNIPFIVVDEKIYQMENSVIKKNAEYYVPIDSFFNILSIHGSDSHSVDYSAMSISLNASIQKESPPLVITDLTAEKNKWKFNTIIIDPGHGGKAVSYTHLRAHET